MVVFRCLSKSSTGLIQLVLVLSFVWQHSSAPTSEDDGSDECYEEFRESSGEITYFSRPSNQQENRVCTYVIRVPEEKTVRISFHCITPALEGCYEEVFLSVKKKDTWIPINDVFYAEAQKDVCNDGNDLSITLRADGMLSEREFQITYNISDIKCEDQKSHPKKNLQSVQKKFYRNLDYLETKGYDVWKVNDFSRTSAAIASSIISSRMFNEFYDGYFGTNYKRDLKRFLLSEPIGVIGKSMKYSAHQPSEWETKQLQRGNTVTPKEDMNNGKISSFPPAVSISGSVLPLSSDKHSSEPFHDADLKDDNINTRPIEFLPLPSSGATIKTPRLIKSVTLSNMPTIKPLIITTDSTETMKTIKGHANDDEKRLSVAESNALFLSIDLTKGSEFLASSYEELDVPFNGQKLIDAFGNGNSPLVDLLPFPSLDATIKTPLLTNTVTMSNITTRNHLFKNTTSTETIETINEHTISDEKKISVTKSISSFLTVVSTKGSELPASFYIDLDPIFNDLEWGFADSNRNTRSIESLPLPSSGATAKTPHLTKKVTMSKIPIDPLIMNTDSTKTTKIDSITESSVFDYDNLEQDGMNTDNLSLALDRSKVNENLYDDIELSSSCTKIKHVASSFSKNTEFETFFTQGQDSKNPIKSQNILDRTLLDPTIDKNSKSLGSSFTAIKTYIERNQPTSYFLPSSMFENTTSSVMKKLNSFGLLIRKTKSLKTEPSMSTFTKDSQKFTIDSNPSVLKTQLYSKAGNKSVISESTGKFNASQQQQQQQQQQQHITSTESYPKFQTLVLQSKFLTKEINEVTAPISLPTIEGTPFYQISSPHSTYQVESLQRRNVHTTSEYIFPRNTFGEFSKKSKENLYSRYFFLPTHSIFSKKIQPSVPINHHHPNTFNHHATSNDLLQNFGQEISVQETFSTLPLRSIFHENSLIYTDEHTERKSNGNMNTMFTVTEVLESSYKTKMKSYLPIPLYEEERETTGITVLPEFTTFSTTFEEATQSNFLPFILDTIFKNSDKIESTASFDYGEISDFLPENSDNSRILQTSISSMPIYLQTPTLRTTLQRRTITNSHSPKHYKSTGNPLKTHAVRSKQSVQGTSSLRMHRLSDIAPSSLILSILKPTQHTKVKQTISSYMCTHPDLSTSTSTHIVPTMSEKRTNSYHASTLHPIVPKMCSEHFIKDIEELEENDPIYWQIQDILSLKLKRIFAVSWPYQGLLGKIGLTHKGHVLQSKNTRLWFTRIQDVEQRLDIIMIDSLLELNQKIKIVFSQDLSNEETIGEHVMAWGLSVGIYLKTCS